MQSAETVSKIPGVIPGEPPRFLFSFNKKRKERQANSIFYESGSNVLGVPGNTRAALSCEAD